MNRRVRISRMKLLVLVTMSAFGLWASSMVVVIYYLLGQSLPFCTSSTSGWIAIDCNAVLSSRYSQVFGVPLEVLAVFYFVVNMALVSLIAFGRQRAFVASLNLLFVWRFIGVLIVPYLVFVELFLLRAICIYCTIMHLAIVADFIVISYLLFFRAGGMFERGSGSDH